MEFLRKQFDTVLSRIEEPRGKIQVIIGPRQVGKSTLMDQVLAKTTLPYTLAKADNVDPQDINHKQVFGLVLGYHRTTR